MAWHNFRWEGDDWWWEIVRLDEMGLPAWANFRVPDKLMHFLACFALGWLMYALVGKWVGKYWAVVIPWVLMMGLWEVLWDGCFRYGASWRDMIANTLGSLLCLWWLFSYSHVGQSQL